MRGFLQKTLFILSIIVLSQAYSFAQSVDGTYVLESRVLADGTVIKPPQILGVYNLEAGYINFNLAYKDNSEKIQSISFIGKYKFSPSKYHQEIFFLSIHDEIYGGDKVHDFSKKEGASPVKIEGDKIEFSFPPQKNIIATFEGNKLSAKRADGSYTDIWKKVD